MRLVIISDTHGLHRQLPLLPAGDALIHCGDWSNRGEIYETVDFLDWYANLIYKHKILIAGNHDWICDKQPHLFRDLLPKNVIYLQDQGIVIDGVKYWGSPGTPIFGDWAFGRRPEIMAASMSIVDPDVEVLICHSPAKGILDAIEDGTECGSPQIRAALNRFAKLKLYCSGHIHSGYGMLTIDKVKFVNAALLDNHYRIVNKPIVVDI